MAKPRKQIGWGTNSNLLWGILNAIDKLTRVTSKSVGGGDLLAANNLSDVASAATSRTNLGIDTTANQTDSTDKRFMTDAQEAKLDAISGTNTGDQDLSGLQPKPAEGQFVDGDKTKLDGIEVGADVTDAINVNAAGAVMESDYTPAHSLLVQQSGTGSPSILSPSNNTVVGKLTGDIVDLNATQLRTLINVEDGADVTDATNVDAAGAVMNTDASTASMSFVIDEDDMASDSATKVPTQQSVKAYVDANAGGGGDVSQKSGDVITAGMIPVFSADKEISGTTDIQSNAITGGQTLETAKDKIRLSAAAGTVYLEVDESNAVVKVGGADAIETNAVRTPTGTGTKVFLDDGTLVETSTLVGLPAPYLFKVAPISLPPSTTDVVNIYSDYITSDTTVTIEGQTVNSVTYKFDNNNVTYLQVSVTTGATEGDFDVTLNNGTESVFTDAFIVNLGTIYFPTSADWTSIVNSLNVANDGEALLPTYNSGSSGIWTKEFDYTKSFYVDFTFNKSALGDLANDYRGGQVKLLNVSDDSRLIAINTWLNGANNFITTFDGVTHYDLTYNPSGDQNAQAAWLEASPIRIYWDKDLSIFTVYVNGVLEHTYTNEPTQNLRLQINDIQYVNVVDIKYIELP